MIKLYSLVFILLITMTARSQTRIWNGGSGNWNDATRWEPLGVPVASDIIEFNGVSGTISNTPSISFRGIIVNSSNIILNSSASADKTLTIGFSSFDTAITISADASLTIGNNLNIALANNARAVIDGTLIITTNRNYYTNTGETTKTIVNGTIRNNGGTIVAGGNMLEFKNGSVYEHARDKGIIPVATWDRNSTCSIEGVVENAPDGINQKFGNYKWDCPHQANGASLGNGIPSNISGDLLINKTSGTDDPSIFLQFPGRVKIGRNFILNGGNCIARENVTIDLAGDFIMKGGRLKANAVTGNASININFSGTGKQLFSKSGNNTTTRYW